MSQLNKVIKEINQQLSEKNLRKISTRNLMMGEALDVYKWIDAQFSYYSAFPSLPHQKKRDYQKKRMLFDAVNQLKERGFRRPIHLKFLAEQYCKMQKELGLV